MVYVDVLSIMSISETETFQCINDNPCGLSDLTVEGLTGRQRLESFEERMGFNLLEAFIEMRESGFITDLGTSDCNSCGGYEQTQHAVELVDAGYEVKGAVSFTAQDSPEKPNLRYGPLHSDEKGVIGLDTQEVGERVTAILDDHDVSYDWDGDPSSTILVV